MIESLKKSFVFWLKDFTLESFESLSTHRDENGLQKTTVLLGRNIQDTGPE